MTLKHGYFSKLQVPNDSVQLSELFSTLSDEYQPRGYISELLVQQLCIDVLRLQRLQTFEGALYREEALSDGMFRDKDKDGQVIIPHYLWDKLTCSSKYETTVLNRILRITEIIGHVSNTEMRIQSENE